MISDRSVIPQQLLVWQALRHCHSVYAAGKLSSDEYQTLKNCILNVGIRKR